MRAFHLRLFEIVRPRNFTLVTTSIGLLLIVTASKESADLEKLICNSLHLVSFNWDLSVSACLTSSSTATWIPPSWPLWTVSAIDVLPKVNAINSDVIYLDQEEPGPQFGPLRYTCPDWSPIRVAIMGELHSLLPVCKKVRNPVQQFLQGRQAWRSRQRQTLPQL